MIKNILIKSIHWIFTLFVIIYILTGFGITEFRIVESITAGLLSKPLAFQLHTYLIYPFIALLLLHIGTIIYNRKKR